MFTVASVWAKGGKTNNFAKYLTIFSRPTCQFVCCRHVKQSTLHVSTIFWVQVQSHAYEYFLCVEYEYEHRPIGTSTEKFTRALVGVTTQVGLLQICQILSFHNWEEGHICKYWANSYTVCYFDTCLVHILW